MAELCLHLTEDEGKTCTTDKELLQRATSLSTKPEAAKLAIRLHLFTLLFEVGIF